MKLHEQMHRWFLRDLFSTARGRAYVMSQAAEAESTGEGRIFEVLLDHVHEPELERMVRKHRDDEIRHTALYRDCAERQGVVLPPVPESLRVIDKIDEHIGRTRKDGERFFAAKVHDERYVMESYLFLQVLEERAVQQFTVMADEMRPFDRQSADIIVEIEADERRHLRYCHAISKRYAPNPLDLETTLAAFRHAEALAYKEHTRQSLGFILDHGFLSSPVRTLLWRGVLTASAFASLPFTDLGRPARGEREERSRELRAA